MDDPTIEELFDESRQDRIAVHRGERILCDTRYKDANGLPEIIHGGRLDHTRDPMTPPPPMRFDDEDQP